MDLFLKATTNAPDLIVDYIQVNLKSGKAVSLNWDKSDVVRLDSECSSRFTANYLYLYFDE